MRRPPVRSKRSATRGDGDIVLIESPSSRPTVETDSPQSALLPREPDSSRGP